MANETPQIMESTSDVTAQPTQSVTVASRRKTTAASKRGRPKKSTAMVPVTTASLTRTTRRIAKPKTTAKLKAAPAAPRVTLLNRLVNISVVAAVFVTALAIQRIVPTESVTTPKVESLPAQSATPAAPAPEAAAAPAPMTTPVAAPAAETTPVAPAQAPAATPAPVAAPAPATKVVAKVVKKAKPAKVADHHTPLNAGGAEDLDGEAARRAYLAKTKLATRTTAPAK